MLSQYSSQALALLLNALPDLNELVTEREDYFEIATTSPSGWDFGVYSDDEQMTVAFAEYHCHIGGYAESTVEKDVAETVELIQALRKEELVLAVWFKGEEYAGSYMLPPNEQPELVVSGQNQVLKTKKWS